MYIEELGTRGVIRLFLEAIGNSLDEARAGFGNQIDITLNEESKWISVKDYGRGIPRGKLETVLTKIHAGGKFDEASYAYSIGMNGVGLKAINALSLKTEVYIERDGKKYFQEFRKGKVYSELENKGKSKKTGTYVKFYPDSSVMEEFEIIGKDYLDLIEKISYLNPNIIFNVKIISKNDKEKDYKIISKNGIYDLLNKLEGNYILDKPISIKGNTKVKNKISNNDESMSLEIIFNYTKNNEDENIKAFTNGLENIEHGTHVQGFKMALTQIISKYIKDNNMIPKKDQNKIIIEPEDTREGLVAVISAYHSNPKFSSQTKNKITNENLLGFGKKLVMDTISDIFVKNKNLAKEICNFVITNAKSRLAAKRAKFENKKKNSNGIFSSISSIGKFVNCNSKNPEEKELFIVEGDSAGGSANQGRDNKTQAIYKLRGVPLNTYDIESNNLQLSKNVEIKDLINIIGTDMSKNFNIENLKFHKIIIMADSEIMSPII